MRKDEIRSLLWHSNPWWQSGGKVDPQEWVKTDPLLCERDRYDLGYRTAILDDVATGPIDAKLIALRGPRGVGKTVALKDTIAMLCGRKDLKPRQIIYMPIDGIGVTELNTVLIYARDMTRSVDKTGVQPRIWLFDGVRTISEWDVTFKFLRDTTALGQDTVVCTGSFWQDSEAKVNPHKDNRILMPMRFRDYVSATRPDISLPPALMPWELQTPKAKQFISRMKKFSGELDSAWQAYLTSGGFPRAAGEYHREGAVSTAFLNDIISRLQQNIGNKISVDSIAHLLSVIQDMSKVPFKRAAATERLGLTSRAVLGVRTNRLIHSFAALWCPQAEREDIKVQYTEPKLYLADPLFAHIGKHFNPASWDPSFSALSEAALATTLALAIENHQPGSWISEDTLGHLRIAGEREVDFAPVPLTTATGSYDTTALDSAWADDDYWPLTTKIIREFFGSGILATKSLLNIDDEIWAVPAPIVALMLD